MKSSYYKHLIKGSRSEEEIKKIREMLVTIDHKKIKEKSEKITKSELIKDLNRHTGKIILIDDTDLAEYFHLEDIETLKPYLCDLESISKKYFFITDVAGAIKLKT